MAKASINLQKQKKNGLKHCDRTEKNEPDYLLPKKFRLENIINRTAIEAEALLKKLKAQADLNYQEHFGQKNQAQNYILEAVVNLNHDHTEEDLKELVKKLEEETGFTCVQYAWHRDEGRLATNLKTRKVFAKRNEHVHLSFFTLDKKTGQQLYRKQVTAKQKEANPELKPFNIARMRALQDLVAETLNMERGKPGATRLSAKGYKQAQKMISEAKRAERAKQADLKRVNKELREQLAAKGATRADYALLEAEIAELRTKIKAKDLSIDELRDKVAELETQTKLAEQTDREEDGAIALAQERTLEAQTKLAEQAELRAKTEIQLKEQKKQIEGFETKVDTQEYALGTKTAQIANLKLKLEGMLEYIQKSSQLFIDSLNIIAKERVEKQEETQAIIAPNQDMLDGYEQSSINNKL